VRLSKENPKFLVSCGAKTDVTVKLWNIASQEKEAINQIITNQLIHRDMAASAETDLFAIATATSEIKVFKIGPPAKPIPGKELVLEKALTLVTHKSDVLTINMHGRLCASIARDNQLLIHKIEGEFPVSSLAFQMALDASTVNDTTRVAVYHSDELNHYTAYFALAYNSSNLEVYRLSLKESKPNAVRILSVEGDQIHNCQSIDFLEFVRVSQDVVLASGSALDLKINLWNVGD